MVKNNIRKSLLEQGLTLSEKFILSSNNKIQEKFLKYLSTLEFKKILLYSPYKNEIKLNLVLKKLNEMQKEIFIPKVFPNNELKFNLLESCNQLIKNKYNILESQSNLFVKVNMINVLVVPFLGVDANGKRLGYGGGYYDRALGNILSKNDKPLIIGLGYDHQILKENFGESHDLKYDKVFTETNIHNFS